MTVERRKKLDQVIEDLVNTYQEVDIVAEEWGVFDMTSEDYNYIFDYIFRCDDCGCWCENCEQNEGFFGTVCDDCAANERNDC